MEIRNLGSYFFWLFKEGYRSQRFPPTGESHDSWVQLWQYAWGLHLVWWIAKKNLNKEKASGFIIEGKCHIPLSFTKMFSVWVCGFFFKCPQGIPGYVFSSFYPLHSYSLWTRNLLSSFNIFTSLSGGPLGEVWSTMSLNN